MKASSAKRLLNSLEQEWLVDLIKEAELNSLGEIRVHLEDNTLLPVLDRATEVFAALNMHHTNHRNGVLIYVAARQRKATVIGDYAIHQHVTDEFWEACIQNLRTYFKQQLYYEGLATTIRKIGIELNKHFPLKDNRNPNELTDELSFG